MASKHYDTPTKAKVKGAIEFLEAKGIEHKKQEVFDFFGVKSTQGYELLRASTTRKRHHNPELLETRGRHSKLSGSQIREADSILEEEELGIEGKRYTWTQIGLEIGAEVHGHTMKRNLQAALNYYKCLACVKNWLDSGICERRVKWAEEALELRPEPENWEDVRFSDEIHGGYGPEGKIRILRKPGNRYRWDCIQHQDSPSKKDQKRKHAWASVGYNFKSEITFYDVPGNVNGKMSQQVYIDSILEPVVKPWLENQGGERFTLEEDGDSGHGPGKSNIVRTWKEKNGLKTYFNCPQSPDLAPIENCWQPVKDQLRKYPHWDDSTMENLMWEGWEKVSQDFINKQVHSMPQRLKDCIASGGVITGY